MVDNVRRDTSFSKGETIILLRACFFVQSCFAYLSHVVTIYVISVNKLSNEIMKYVVTWKKEEQYFSYVCL
jgi:hypothetical protein